MLSYVIVGSGYRAEYFGRVAARYPELFRAKFLCRSVEQAERMTLHTGIEATVSQAECLDWKPDFAVVAVDRGHVAEVAEEWIRMGFPVVTETPVGDTVEKLARLQRWADQGARIVCCEQYHRYPILAAGLKAIREGLIGEPSSLYISLLHDYHAASLIRLALQVPPDEPYTVCGTRMQSPAAETDSRYGAFYDGRTASVQRDLMLVSFASGKEALYDFCPVQYRSFIRSRHLTVRGSRGEWSDTQLLWLDGNNEPQRTALLPDLPGKYRCLDTQALRDRRRNWSAELAPDTVQDEFAIASILLDMEAYLAGGPSPYPLDEAMADARFWLTLQEAAGAPLRCVSSDPDDRRP